MHRKCSNDGGQDIPDTYPGMAIAGAGELAMLERMTAGLLSLPILLLLFSLLWVLGVPCPLSASEPKAFAVGAFHDGISQILPVNDFTRNRVFSHFRQALLVRSRARSPALIAP